MTSRLFDQPGTHQTAAYNEHGCDSNGGLAGEAGDRLFRSDEAENKKSHQDADGDAVDTEPVPYEKCHRRQDDDAYKYNIQFRHDTIIPCAGTIWLEQQIGNSATT